MRFFSLPLLIVLALAGCASGPVQDRSDEVNIKFYRPKR